MDEEHLGRDVAVKIGVERVKPDPSEIEARMEELRRVSMLGGGCTSDVQRAIVSGLEMAYYLLTGGARVVESVDSTIPEHANPFPVEVESCKECDVTLLASDGSAGELEDGRRVVWCGYWRIVFPCDEHSELIDSIAGLP
jgi:hypothetical protein